MGPSSLEKQRVLPATTDLEHEIASADTEIHELVYERYGITADQISFIESLIAERPSDDPSATGDEDDE